MLSAYFYQLEAAGYGLIPLATLAVLIVYLILKKWPIPGIRRVSIWVPVALAVFLFGMHWFIRLCCVIL